MRTFGAIFAVLSLAVSASAAAIFPRDGLVDANAAGSAGAAVDNALKGVVHQRELDPTQLTGTLNGVVPDTNTLTPSGITTRDNGNSFPAIVEDVTEQVQGIVAQLDVALKGDVKVAVVVKILGQIKDVLAAAVVKIDALVKGNARNILVLDGKVQAVADIAKLLSVLIHVCVNAIAAVLKVKAISNDDLVVEVCTAISVHVALVVSAGISLVNGLTVEIVPLVRDIMGGLHLHVCAAIATVLKIN